MMTEIRGSVPKIPISYAKTLVNRAYRTVRESNLWSFQLFDSSWITPPLINAGTVTVTQGANTVTFDATAMAVLNVASTNYSLITQRQFRVGVVGGIYNLIAYNSATGVATLDRIYGDPTATGASYQVYQLYYTPPMQDFLTWKSVRNPQMFIDLDLNQTRAETDARDPQRSWYQFPTAVIPWGIDIRGAGTATPSPTLGFPLFELWGQPVTLFVYQCYGIRRGVDLVNPSDSLPVQIGEELVLAKAREYAYEWAEANKDMSPRSSGPDWKYLMGKTKDEFKESLIRYRKQDKELLDNWFSTRAVPWGSHMFGQYSTMAGYASPYTPI